MQDESICLTPFVGHKNEKQMSKSRKYNTRKTGGFDNAALLMG
jgi:hypothetical protein